MTESEEDAYDRAEKQWEDYYQSEVLIKAQIYTRVPEAFLIEIRKLSTAKETWDTVCAKYEHTVKIDIYCCMYEMKCKDDSNVCMHLETMMCVRATLASSGDQAITLAEGKSKVYKQKIHNKGNLTCQRGKPKRKV